MTIALTFDAEHPDHPTTDPIGNTHKLLDVLNENLTSATFFIQGAWACAYPALVRRIVNEGHLIGSHSYSHCSFERLTTAGMIEDLRRCRALLDDFALTERRFRLPFGEGAVGAHSARIKAALSEVAYEHIGWTCGGNDWMPGASPEEVANPIVASAYQARGLCIPVLHTWPDATHSAVDMVIRRVLANARFVRLDEKGVEEELSSVTLSPVSDPASRAVD